MNITQVIRDALKTVADPDKAETKRIMAIARAKLQQEGHDNVEIQEFHVYQTKAKLRDTMGKPITKEKIVQYERKYAHIIRTQQNGTTKTSPKAVLTTPSYRVEIVDTNRPSTPNVTLTDVQQLLLTRDFLRLESTQQFLTKVGGLQRACFLFQTLEELTHDRRPTS